LPVFSFEDAVDAEITAPGILADPGAEQAQFYPPGFGQISAADVGVAGAKLADHFADEVGEVGAVLHKGDQRCIFLPDGGPVHPVHIGSVEKVTHLPPAFGEDLLPFRLAIKINLHAVEVELVLDFDFGGRQIDDGVGGTLLDEHLFLIGGDFIAVDLTQFRLLELFKIIE